MYDRGKFNKVLVSNNPLELKLTAGIECHLLGDRLFHGSDYFKQYTHGIKLILERSTLNKDVFRFSFLSHVLLEMMIDRLLLTKKQDIGAQFYDNLSLCNEDLLLYFAQRNSTVDERFVTVIQKFKHHKFILNYTNTDAFVNSFCRTIGKVGIIFSEAQKKEVTELMSVIEKYIDESMSTLFLLFARHD